MTEPAGNVEGPSPTEADVGVLLVHGIGEDAEGDNLLFFGEPMTDWLREWMAGAPGRGTAEVTRARLLALRTEAESPAFARMELTGVGPSKDPQSWLLAEAWWGETVRPPAPLRLLGWMLSRVPLLVLWHFRVDRTVARRQLPAWISWLVPFFYARAIEWLSSLLGNLKRMLFPVVVALLLQTVVAVAIVLSCVPFGPWRQGLVDLVRKLTFTLGDAYVLLEQDIQRSALIERVRSKFEWLSRRVSRVVVIAHSQGGVVSHAALQQSDLTKLAAYISVGSGHEKLEFLRLVRQSRRGLLGATLVGPMAAVAVALFCGPLWTNDVKLGNMWLMLGFTTFIVFWVMLYRLLRVLGGYSDKLAVRFKTQGLRNGAGPVPWFDVRAGFDLVPMGSNSQLASLDVVEAVQVVNELSLVFDHVTYFSTRCDFLARCWQMLDRSLGLGLFDPEEHARIHRVAVWHRWRALALASSIVLSPAAVFSAIALHGETMAHLGRMMLDALNGARLDWLATALHWSAEKAAQIIGVGPAVEQEPRAVADRTHIVVSTLALSAGVVAWWFLALALWRRSCDAFWRRHGARQSGLAGWPWRVASGLGVTAWALVAALPCAAVLAVAEEGNAVSLSGIGRMFLLVPALLLVAAGLMLGAGLSWIGDARARAEMLWAATWAPLWSGAAGAVIAVAGTALLDVANVSIPLDNAPWLYFVICAVGWSAGMARDVRRQRRFMLLLPGPIAALAAAALGGWLQGAPRSEWLVWAAIGALVAACLVQYRLASHMSVPPR